VDRCSEIYERCTFPDRLEEVKKRGHKVLYMTTNGVPLSVKQISSDESLHLVGTFFNLGVRMMHLTYNRRNLIGDGCVEEANGGLSGFGRQAIAEMNRCGVIPDVAHTGQRSSLEAAQCSKRPVVASHSAVWKFSGHCRAKDDEVIEAIAKTNGYIGICGYPGFLGGSGDINALLDTIDYVAKKFGVDHVAIGTDRGVSLTPWEFNDKIPNSRKIWEQYWGNVNCSNSGTEEQFGSVCWTNWPLFTVGLVMRGYSDADIRKIIGGNVLRVCRDSMP
jgi:membrane dipeptidase